VQGKQEEMQEKVHSREGLLQECRLQGQRDLPEREMLQTEVRRARVR
jgi:hypothetical protein